MTVDRFCNAVLELAATCVVVAFFAMVILVIVSPGLLVAYGLGWL